MDAYGQGKLVNVLIPMWWGGFSEPNSLDKARLKSLNPHVVGRFFRAQAKETKRPRRGLNPHVVGRFFRERRGVFFIKFSRLKWPISKLQIFTKINGD